MPAPPKPPASLAQLVERFDPRVFDAPAGQARVRLAVRNGQAWDAQILGSSIRLRPAAEDRRPDAVITADERTWRRVSADLAGGLGAHRAGRLVVRHNMHIGVGFLAATSGDTDEGRLRFARLRTRLGRIATMEAGTGGEPVVMLHGLGGTKISFLPTLAALAPERRVIAVDLPGFGDSDKPIGRYDAAFFARWVEALLDALKLDRAHVLGHSMGGRVALELGIRRPDRVESLMLMTPSLAWRTDRRWAPYLRLLRPELGLLQPTPRSAAEAFVRRVIPGAQDSWSPAGLDELLRAYLTEAGRGARPGGGEDRARAAAGVARGQDHLLEGLGGQRHRPCRDGGVQPATLAVPAGAGRAVRERQRPPEPQPRDPRRGGRPTALPERHRGHDDAPPQSHPRRRRGVRRHRARDERLG